MAQRGTSQAHSELGTVLVTGGSGGLASQILQQLLSTIVNWIPILQ